MRRYEMSVKNKTIAKKLADLEELVAWFENDDFVIEEALDRFKQAEVLAKEISQDLAVLKHDITIIKKDFSVENPS